LSEISNLLVLRSCHPPLSPPLLPQNLAKTHFLSPNKLVSSIASRLQCLVDGGRRFELMKAIEENMRVGWVGGWVESKME
ncbi:hypothetical protein DVH24_029111, partial [Malus domestica]